MLHTASAKRPSLHANIHTHTHMHTQNCTGHAPPPVTAPEQEQQNLHRGSTLTWYSQSHHHHHHRSRRLAADRAMTALLAAWLLHRMHAVTVRMGRSWRLHMRWLRQTLNLRCSQKMLQGQAECLQVAWLEYGHCCGVRVLGFQQRISFMQLRECRHC